MRGGKREAVGLGGALVVHAAALAWIAGHAPVPTVLPPPALPAAEIEIEEARAPETEAASAPALGYTPAPAPALAHTPAPAHAPAPALALAPAPTLDGDSPAPALPDAPPPLASLSADALGLGAHNPFLGHVPGADVPSPAASERPENVAPGVQQSLRDGLQDRDHALGMDRSGPVVAVAEELTRPSATPMNSKASFEVVTDAAGQVLSVQVVDASQGRDEWDKVAAAMLAALRGRPLKVPEGTGGLAFTIEVTSRWQLPSGSDVDTEVSILNIPVKKAPRDQKQPKKVELLAVKPRIVEDPTPGATGPSVLPAYHIELFTLLNVAMDPTDLTPRPLRVVHARVLKERTL